MEKDILRLSKNVISLLSSPDQQLNLAKYKKLFQSFVCSKTKPDNFTENLLEIIDLCVQTDWDQDTNPAAKQSIVCQTLEILLDKTGSALDNERVTQVFDYLLQILNQSKHVEAMLYGILCLEKLLLINLSVLSDKMEVLRQVFQKLSSNICHSPMLISKNPKHVPNLYQIGCCSSWLLERLESKIVPEPVKISPDGLSVRNDTPGSFPTIISPFSLSSGIFYYEVVLVTDGEFRFGWATKQHNFGSGAGLGCDQWSIGIDVFHKWIYHGNGKIPVEHAPCWKPGDIVGCLIDFKSSKFVFYLNGERIHFWLTLFANSFFSQTEVYFPAVSVGYHQQCYINFGQYPFKFGPKDVRFQTIHKEAKKDPAKFRLVKPEMSGENSFWFKELTLGLQREYFHDQTQSRFYSWVMEFEQNPAKIPELPKSSDTFLRLTQALIKMLGITVSKTTRNSLLLYQLITVTSTIETLPCMGKFMQIMHPFLEQNSTFDDDIIKQRNICLVFLILKQVFQKRQQVDIFHKNQFLAEFIEKIFQETQDQWSLLFVIVSMDSWNLITDISTKRLYFLAEDEDNNVFNAQFDPVQFQISFNCSWFLDKISPTKDAALKPTWALNPISCPKNLKLSSDLLSARNDSIQEYLAVKSTFQVSSGIYFYEVTLITPGSLRIGWSSNSRADLADEAVGRFSIGFDGFHLGIFTQGDKRYDLMQPIARWNVGDVVGCLVDVKQCKFKFYLNGKKLEYRKPLMKKMVTGAGHSYCAAVWLGMFQQCVFNFGQAPWRFPPGKEFRSFYSDVNFGKS